MARVCRTAKEFADAVKNNDWEKVSFLIILNPDIMEDGLKRVYPLLRMKVSEK